MGPRALSESEQSSLKQLTSRIAVNAPEWAAGGEHGKDLETRHLILSPSEAFHIS